MNFFSQGTGSFFLIAGPCAIESRDMAMSIAHELHSLCNRLNLRLIFKGSYDKANRTSGLSKRGVGLVEGLEILSQIRQTYDIPVLTDVHLPQDAKVVAEVVDILQIPAFLCRQTDLIEACAKTGRAMNIKKGQFLSPAEMKNVVNKAKEGGCKDILVCERGTTFGYNNLVVDMRGLVWMRDIGCPIVFDATHSAQLPGGDGDRTAGVRETIPFLARAAIAVGVQGIFIETHPTPEKAISDSATQLPLSEMEGLLKTLIAIENATASSL